jgi:hypothetical protein
VSKDLSIVAMVLAFALAFGPVTRAQDKPAPQTAGKPPSAAITPLKIQVVISRYQGDKKISSLPYALSMNSNPEDTDGRNTGRAGHANLRMGTKIPVPMMAPPSVDGKPLKDFPITGPVQYQDVGTNIDCFVWPLSDGRYRVEISIDDSSVYPDDKDTPSGIKGSPSFRSFRASDAMILRDGATSQFTTATDKVSGEIVKVDVTLTVVK